MFNYKNLPRGIRNNNPLNIRRNDITKWVGEVKQLTFKETNEQGVETATTFEDKSFCQFESRAYGWRAAFKTLKTYINNHKRDTIEKIITRWAPKADDNDTEKYIQMVEKHSGVYRHKHLEFNSTDLCLVAAAMCCVENGVKWDPFIRGEWIVELLQGFKMAGGTQEGMEENHG